MNLHCIGGRYPAPCPGLHHNRDAILARLTVCGDEVLLRVEDEKYPDRWEEFRVPLDDLVVWLDQARLRPMGEKTWTEM